METSGLGVCWYPCGIHPYIHRGGVYTSVGVYLIYYIGILYTRCPLLLLRCLRAEDSSAVPAFHLHYDDPLADPGWFPVPEPAAIARFF